MRFYGQASLRLLREHWEELQEAMEEAYAVFQTDVPLTLDGPITINNTTGQPAITVNQLGDSTVTTAVNRPAVTTVPPDALPDLVPSTDPGDIASPGDTTSETYLGIVTELEDVVITFGPATHVFVRIPALDDQVVRVTVETVDGDGNEIEVPGVGDFVIVTHNRDDTWTLYAQPRTVYVGRLLEMLDDNNCRVILYATQQVVDAVIPGLAAGDTVPVDTFATVIRYGASLYFFMAAAAQAASSVYPGKVVSGTGATYIMSIYPRGLSEPAQTVTVLQLQIDPTEEIPAGTWALVSKVGTNYFMQVPVWLSE